MGFVDEDTYQRLLGSCVKFRQTTVGVVKDSARSSCRNVKIDLPCIAVWGRTELYYCQQMLACPSSKMFVKAFMN